MSVTREFLGFTAPPLASSVEYLIQRYQCDQSLDLSPAVLVLPGGRAGRRLLEMLVQRAERDSLILTTPTFETVGRLPELLYQPKRPFATELVQQLVWTCALQGTKATALKHIVPAPPAPDDLTRWMELGDMLRAQHVELAADGLDFGDVVEKGRATGRSFADAKRWKSLRTVQVEYLRQLDDLKLWDIQTARIVAIQQRECQTDRDIFLIGTADMNAAMRQMIDQVADRVTALICAPDDWSDRFDDHGCLIPEQWEKAGIPIDDQRVHLSDRPADQADRTLRCLAQYDGRYRPDEISIGLPDERLASNVQRLLQQNGIPARSAAGVPLIATRPLRLLEAVMQYLRSGRLSEFASLVRHPDLFTWLDNAAETNWLEQLDEFHHSFLQARLDLKWPSAAQRHTAIEAIYKKVSRWLEPLCEPRQPLADWNEPLAECLLAIYADRTWNRDDAEESAVLRALEQIRAVLAEHSETIPASLMPKVDAGEAIQWILRQLQSATIAVPVDQPAIELLGWLELPLDDAPALIVCSFNEGLVPSSINSDIFLPNQLRAHLGLQDNTRRYARDAYALNVLLHTRQSVDLVVGRRNRDGDPLRPSRLLFACDRETLAVRAKRFFAPAIPTADLQPLAGSLSSDRVQSDFVIPLPRPLASPIMEMSVTAFRSYLECPYRFYLGQVLKLSRVDDDVEELSGGEFGNLLHDVLQRFGNGPFRDSSNIDEIDGFLNHELDQCVRERFGQKPLPAVSVQVEQLRLRLRAFAECQSKWIADGWRIEHTEIMVPGPNGPAIVLQVDGEPIHLRGRIDRIDRHTETGDYAVLDYKSSDAGRTPNQTHIFKQEWRDLQLPLYRHLVRGLGIERPLKLGYVLLPKDINRVNFSLADWNEDDLAIADEVAFNVIRKIRNEVFWPPNNDPRAAFQEFAAICQDGVFGRQLAVE